MEVTIRMERLTCCNFFIFKKKFSYYKHENPFRDEQKFLISLKKYINLHVRIEYKYKELR